MGGGWMKDVLPPVLTSLLAGLEAAYAKLPGDLGADYSPWRLWDYADCGAEKRKTWIYEVPLPAVHHLREALNALPLDQPAPADLLAQYDAPIIASTIKLWLLELNPPLALWEGWDEFRKIYPHGKLCLFVVFVYLWTTCVIVVGSAPKIGDANPEEQHLQDLKNALQRLPLIHLHVLDSLLQHLRT
jgi:hypothetical protein